MTTPQSRTLEPAAGQVWKNTRSGRLVEITEAERKPSGMLWTVHWRALTGKGPKKGERWAGGWTDAFEFVAVAIDEAGALGLAPIEEGS